jgi:hypothetical protein
MPSCRPVWDRAPPGGPWVVRGITEGAYLIGHPLHARDDRRFYVSTGWEIVTNWRRAPDFRVDPDATLKAWREWCAARRAAEVCPGVSAGIGSGGDSAMTTQKRFRIL